MKIPKPEYVIAVGNLVSGFSFHGPFSSPEDSIEYAEKHFPRDEWHTPELIHPTTLEPPTSRGNRPGFFTPFDASFPEIPQANVPDVPTQELSYGFVADTFGFWLSYEGKTTEYEDFPEFGAVLKPLLSQQNQQEEEA